MNPVEPETNVSNRPNILWFIPHDLGRYLHCYGNSTVKSPNLDRLAGEGVLFTNHFTASTACSPARGCAMTGRYAHSNGLMGLVNRGWDLPATEKTLTNYLSEAAYYTYCCGGQHERKDPEANGYDRVEVMANCHCDRVYSRAMEFLKSDAAAQKPFYLNLYTHEVHLPFSREDTRPERRDGFPQYPSHDPEAVDVPGWLPDMPGVRRGLAKFQGSIEFMDKWVGETLAALDETGLADNTVVIFTTDHGIAFPGAKAMLTDPGTGVTLIMRFPASMGVKQGVVRKELLSNIDVLPTLLEMLEIEPEPAIQGRSFWPLLRAAEYAPRTEVFAEKTYHDRYDPKRCVRTDRYKYIRNFVSGPKLSVAWDVMRSDASDPPPPAVTENRRGEELYDLERDPFEKKNLAGEEAFAGIRRDLAARLQTWMQKTDDPLLTLPPGQVIPFPPEQVL